MKLISPFVHGLLDYVMMMSMLILPLAFMINGKPELIVIVFALFEFILAVVTRYPLGATRQVPFPVHGVIELLCGVGLIAAPWVLGFAGMTRERNYYVVMGVYFVVLYALTDFRGDASSAGTEAPLVRV
jgi:hypothetical protein